MLQHHSARSAPTPRSPVEGLWVLLVDGEPMMAQAGDNKMYLLGFKTAVKARQFIASQDVVAEIRMIVRGNKDELLARATDAAGVLVDYDVATQKYAAAIEL
jgi:hypothetical protein